MRDLPPITSIGIVTADRPAILRRSLASMVRHCDAFGRRPRVLVIDGSREPTNRSATENAVSTAAAASGHDLQYVGTAEAAAVSATLASAGAPALEMMPGTAGANRNLLLLLTSGEHVLTVDDDVLWDTWALPTRTNNLTVTGHDQEFLETDFFPTRRAALSAVARTPVDLIAAHEDLLGRMLPDAIARSPATADLTGSCGHLLAALRDGRFPVVKSTFVGIAGDAGTYCPHRLLWCQGRLRDRLWSSATTFATAMTSREVTRIAATPVVTHDVGFMATCTGVANRTLVPPFMPVGRNEDGVFGVMLAMVDPTTVFGHLPIGVIHDSDRSSLRPEGTIVSATQSRLAELVLSLSLHHRPPHIPATTEARLRQLGEKLEHYGRLDAADFVALVRQVTAHARTLEFEYAERAIAMRECPTHWRRALARYRREFLASVETPGFFLPVEFRGLGSIEIGYAAVQRFLREFGELVRSWPSIWEVARGVNAGRRAALSP